MGTGDVFRASLWLRFALRFGASKKVVGIPSVAFIKSTLIIIAHLTKFLGQSLPIKSCPIVFWSFFIDCFFSQD